MTNASEPTNAASDPKSLALSLSDFALIEVFEGSYPLGERSEGFFTVERSDGTRHRPPTRYAEQDPSHKFVVNAKWKYEPYSEKLVLGGEEINPGVLEI